MHEKEKLKAKELARAEATELAAKVLIKIRKECHLSQLKLAQLSGRKQSYISRVESRQQNISLATLQEIVNAVGGTLHLDVDLSDSEKRDR